MDDHTGLPALHDLFQPVIETIGVKLLRSMGWKPHQGSGQRLTKREKKERKKKQVHIFLPTLLLVLFWNSVAFCVYMLKAIWYFTMRPSTKSSIYLKSLFHRIWNFPPIFISRNKIKLLIMSRNNFYNIYLRGCHTHGFIIWTLIEN